MWVKTDIGEAFVPEPLDFECLRPHPDSEFESTFAALDRLRTQWDDLERDAIYTRILFQRECQRFSPRLSGARLADRAYVNSPFVAFHVFDSIQSLCYARAFEYAWRSRRKPLSKGLLKEVHARLIPGHERSGRFRSIGVWLGPRGKDIKSASIIFAPSRYVAPCLHELYAFAQVARPAHRIASAAVLHYQFTAIHPFFDANGRVARIITPLLLRESDVIDVPLLYVSEVLQQRYWDYSAALRSVDRFQEWSTWIRLFAQMLAEAANKALHVMQLTRRVREFLAEEVARRSGAGSVMPFVDESLLCPTFTSDRAAELLQISNTDAVRLLSALEGTLGLAKIVEGDRPTYQWAGIFQLFGV